MKIKKQRDRAPAILLPADAQPAPELFPAAAVAAEEKRGPGRPPKLCIVCSKPAGECQGHTSTGAAPPSFTEETIKYGLQFVSQMIAVGASIAADVSIPEAIKMIGFSEGEIAVLSPSATVVANKYLPDWLSSNQAEVNLMFVAAPILIGKIVIVKSLMDRAKKDRAEAAKTAAVNAAPVAKPSLAHPEEAKGSGQAMAA